MIYYQHTEVHQLARHRHPRAAPGDSHESNVPSSSCWKKTGIGIQPPPRLESIHMYILYIYMKNKNQ